MPSDARRIARTQARLVKAHRDLLAAELLLAQADPFLDMAVYHCQQAAEKALKGFLFWHDVPFRKTHNLVELLDQCVILDEILCAFNQTAQRLSRLVPSFATQATCSNHRWKMRKMRLRGPELC